MTFEFKDYISIAALIISVVSLYFARFDKKIKLDAQLNFDGELYSLDIYNNSNRQVTISRIDIFSAKSKNSSEKKSTNTWYDGNFSNNFVIKSMESENIQFDEPYELNGFMYHAKETNIYVTLFVSGKMNKTFKLR